MIEFSVKTLGELNELWESGHFKSWPFTPISRLRIISYNNLPFVLMDDTVLILIYSGGKPAGFRLLLPQRFEEDGEPVLWGSGIYLHPVYRSMGISRQLQGWLFDHMAEKRFGITNCGPATHHIYSTDIRFSYYSRPWYRSYLQLPKWQENRNFSPQVNFLSGAFNPLWKRWMEYVLKKTELNIVCKKIKEDNLPELPEKQLNHLRWAVKYPWQTEAGSLTDEFPFSHYVDKTGFYEFYDGGRLIALSHLINDHMRMICESNSLDQWQVLKWCAKNDIATVDFQHPMKYTRKVENGLFYTPRAAFLKDEPPILWGDYIMS